MGVLNLKRHVARHISQESREMFAIAAQSKDTPGHSHTFLHCELALSRASVAVEGLKFGAS
ncbi:hypothetical protein SNOG_11373 [Parastagonospora nodorum SN15]|uniref:Uncharacterized protein n=1 Tax=Phaeosphaeria nodorum (strain SN15 / ATCC MYA-4574 / FGSC 10173) TaxID=321614 RepID=Q0UA41_PHANO|nr:hypothetical protein SNOG_11373 [Parastagonospora nodorum SN15]EAT81081.1 hypothetical protein SNOG_11373 [Parastagonospora nodorum SN15]